MSINMTSVARMRQSAKLREWIQFKVERTNHSRGSIGNNDDPA